MIQYQRSNFLQSSFCSNMQGIVSILLLSFIEKMFLILEAYGRLTVMLKAPILILGWWSKDTATEFSAFSIAQIRNVSPF
jgi:hypothetical protein